MGYSNSQHSFGHTALGTEYCSGFRDVHGQWNNGFYCPKWGSQDQEYCCGPTEHRYCCPKAETLQKLHSDQATQLALLVGLAVGTFVLLVGTTVLSCYFCRCCWAYKRRKRAEGSVVLPDYPGHSRDSTDPVSFAVCSPGIILPEFMRSAVEYTREAPPPYPGYYSDAPPIECKQSVASPEIQQASDANLDHSSTQLGVPPSPQSHVMRPSMMKVPCAGRSEDRYLVGRESRESPSVSQLTNAPLDDASEQTCQLCCDECRGYPQSSFQFSTAKPRTKLVNPLGNPAKTDACRVRRESVESETVFC